MRLGLQCPNISITLGHKEKHETIWKSLIPSEDRSCAKTGRILGGIQAVSGFDQVPRDAIHWGTRVHWMRDKTAPLTWLTVMLLSHAIWTETVGSRGPKSTAEKQPDG